MSTTESKKAKDLRPGDTIQLNINGTNRQGKVIRWDIGEEEILWQSDRSVSTMRHRCEPDSRIEVVAVA